MWVNWKNVNTKVVTESWMGNLAFTDEVKGKVDTVLETSEKFIPAQKFQVKKDPDSNNPYEIGHSDLFNCDHKVWNEEIDDSSFSSAVLIQAMIWDASAPSMEEFINNLLTDEITMLKDGDIDEEYFSTVKQVAEKTVENMLEKWYIVEKEWNILVNIEIVNSI